MHCKERRFLGGFPKGFLLVLRREPLNGCKTPVVGFSRKPFTKGFGEVFQKG